jgi:hypothetical protein
MGGSKGMYQESTKAILKGKLMSERKCTMINLLSKFYIIGLALLFSFIVYADDELNFVVSKNGFFAASALPQVSNATVTIAFSTERFATNHVLNTSVVTNIIQALDGSVRYRTPNKSWLRERGLSRWSFPCRSFQIHILSDSGKSSWIVIYGPAAIFSWEKRMYVVAKESQGKVMSLLQSSKEQVTMSKIRLN